MGKISWGPSVGKDAEQGLYWRPVHLFRALVGFVIQAILYGLAFAAGGRTYPRAQKGILHFCVFGPGLWPLAAS